MIFDDDEFKEHAEAVCCVSSGYAPRQDHGMDVLW